MNTNISLKQFINGYLSLRDYAEHRLLPQMMANVIKRTRLWELKDMYHCPVVGTCLSLDELAKFARRFELESSQADAFTLHVAVVNHARTRNPLSKAIQKHLDAKYRHIIACFNQAKSDQEVEALWRDFLNRGEGAGGMWAALTHKSVSDKTRELIYAEMHMLSHQVGANHAVDMRKLRQLEQENLKLHDALDLMQRRYAQARSKWQQKLDKAIQLAESQCQQQHVIEKMQADLFKFESGQAITEMGKRLMALVHENDKLLAAAERVNALEKSLHHAHAEIAKLKQERNALADQCALFDSLAKEAVHSDDELMEGEQQTCAISLTAKKCVLCVGGRVALLPQYRALAQRYGFNLIHHDGGLHESLSRLPELINKASTVICPTDSVSHAAYYLLKRYCKRQHKPCLLYKGAGISRFTQILDQLTAGKSHLNGYAKDALPQMDAAGANNMQQH
ncbi:MAG: DUF2325 domain-containing protein [Nitrosomonas sp.]|nr:DUF2325 domain-containing protein [Nitrosomonas sp.]